MSQRLENKVALVTGGGRGLGAATAKRFAEEGAHVYVTDLDLQAAENIAGEIVADGGSATALLHDVTIEDDWAPLMNKIVENHGGLDVMVNNAGIVIPATVEDAKLEDWRITQKVNVEGVFMGTRAAIGVMKEKGGSIINLSSVAGLVGGRPSAAYCTSKGAVRLFTKSAAIHCAEEGYNIRINSVHPGIIRSQMFDDALAAQKGDPAEIEAMTVADIPFKTLGEPIDVANGCLFLASDESKYMTGSELVIDGGLTCK